MTDHHTRAPDNFAAGKRSMQYDGHNRKPGIGSTKRADRARAIRRRTRAAQRRLYPILLGSVGTGG